MDERIAEIRNVEMGRFFILENRVFVSTGEKDGAFYWSVSLRTGELVAFHKTVKAKLIPLACRGIVDDFLHDESKILLPCEDSSEQ